ncbi:uncharacterized protein SPSK_07917 [Sporothrix schenckii 1099-18]|uniref:Uncharacterized protein n=1 Tax=Sporothrix schenckii 1099-18 TaxID=1397361 RepID=A0A0F2MHV4_SPOSC|nr:uncharacterized protein SPSK_07917 [Sporothrix schenckii 1099-18]KJR88634.1 hypothetical protein SPSK_07917 [Sporothrix schenckii 1099-18]
MFCEAQMGLTLGNVGKGLGNVLGDEEGVGKLIEAFLGGGLVRRRAHGLARRGRGEAGGVGTVRDSRMKAVLIGHRVVRGVRCLGSGALLGACTDRHVDDSLARAGVAALEAIAVVMFDAMHGQAVVGELHRMVDFVILALLVLLVLAKIVYKGAVILGRHLSRRRRRYRWKRQQSERRGRGSGHEGGDGDERAHVEDLLSSSESAISRSPLRLIV